MPVTGNTEQVGWLLYTSYLIPFEIASMLLLVAMIGAIGPRSGPRRPSVVMFSGPIDSTTQAADPTRNMVLVH